MKENLDEKIERDIRKEKLNLLRHKQKDEKEFKTVEKEIHHLKEHEQHYWGQ